MKPQLLQLLPEEELAIDVQGVHKSYSLHAMVLLTDGQPPHYITYVRHSLELSSLYVSVINICYLRQQLLDLNRCLAHPVEGQISLCLVVVVFIVVVVVVVSSHHPFTVHRLLVLY